MFCNDEYIENTFLQIVSTLSLRVTNSNTEHDENAELPIAFTTYPILTVSNE